jgi:hypothetical protein
VYEHCPAPAAAHGPNPTANIITPYVQRFDSATESRRRNAAAQVRQLLRSGCVRVSRSFSSVEPRMVQAIWLQPRHHQRRATVVRGARVSSSRLAAVLQHGPCRRHDRYCRTRTRRAWQPAPRSAIFACFFRTVTCSSSLRRVCGGGSREAFWEAAAVLRVYAR